MILNLLEIGVFTSLAIFIAYWNMTVRRRQARTWDLLAAQLHPARSYMPRELNPHPSWADEQNRRPEEMWRQIRGATGLWEMFVNAGVMLDMADFASRNSDSVDCELLAALRNDAMQIRVCVLTVLAKHAGSKVTGGIGANVSRAAAHYADMVARTAELLRVNGGSLAPSIPGGGWLQSR